LAGVLNTAARVTTPSTSTIDFMVASHTMNNLGMKYLISRRKFDPTQKRRSLFDDRRGFLSCVTATSASLGLW
jgi:hypothetical protein